MILNVKSPQVKGFLDVKTEKENARVCGLKQAMIKYYI